MNLSSSFYDYSMIDYLKEEFAGKLNVAYFKLIIKLGVTLVKVFYELNCKRIINKEKLPGWLDNKGAYCPKIIRSG